jgi:hypothetical protein
MAVHSASNDPTLPEIAADNVGGVNYQQVKLDVGKAGASKPVTNPYPWHPMGYGDSMNLDAFSRLRTSEPSTLFESAFEYDLQATFFEPVTTAGGTVTFDSNKRSAILAVSTGATDSAFLQSRQYWPYEKGKSRLVKMTFLMGTPAANVRRRVGYFDAANGIFLQQTSDGLTLTLRSSVSGSVSDANSVPQASWNIDTMDGTGPSGITLDVTKSQILLLDLQFLGVGRARVAFDIGGVIVPVHQFLNANASSVAPYMQTATLPVRWEIANTAGTVGATSLQAICCDVESEGGAASPVGYFFSAANATDISTSASRTYALSIRPTTTFNGIVNRMSIVPLEIGALIGSQSVLVEVFYNSTLTGGTWTSVSPLSGVEVGIGQSISVLGVPVDSFWAAEGAGTNRGATSTTLASQFPIGLDSAGTNPRPLTICFTTTTGTGTGRCTIHWKEIR